MQDADTSLPPIRADGLQLEEDRPLQERIWTMERVAHGVFGLLVVAGLSGLAGSGGPIADTTLTGDAGSVTLPRIARWETPAEVAVGFTQNQPRHRLTLAGPFVDRMIVESVQPQPARSSAGPDGLVYEFAAEGRAAARATLRVSPSRPGLSRLRIALDDAAPLSAAIVVLP
jgi:hypothetical protein